MKDYVKKYEGLEVPEGATHYAKNAMFLFYKIISGSHYFYDRFNGEWRISSGGCFDSAIELPEEPKAEFVPEVGEECEMLDDRGRWVVVHIFAEHDGFIHGWHKERTTSYYSNDLAEFRPLKTKEEKEREAFIEKAKRVARTTDDVLTHDRLFGLLFDSGAEFTTPKEGEL